MLSYLEFEFGGGGKIVKYLERLVMLVSLGIRREEQLRNSFSVNYGLMYVYIYMWIDTYIYKNYNIYIYNKRKIRVMFGIGE